MKDLCEGAAALLLIFGILAFCAFVAAWMTVFPTIGLLWLFRLI